MKIHGSNQTNFNPYKDHMQKQTKQMKELQKKDQLEISNEAKNLLKDTKPDASRGKYIEELKQSIDADSYRVDYEKTAEKMMDFWSKNS